MWSDEHVKEVLSVYYPTLDYAHGPVTGTISSFTENSTLHILRIIEEEFEEHGTTSGNASNGDIYADYGTILALIFPFPCYTFILTVRYKVCRSYLSLLINK